MNAVRHWGEAGYRKAAKASWLRFYEGVFDGAHPLLQKERDRGVGVGANEYGKSAYVAYRLGTGVADFMHHILQYGALKWQDGALTSKPNTRGLMPMLSEELGEDLNNWLVWMAANRAMELKRQGREKNLDKYNILEGIKRAKGKKLKFERVRKEYIAMNDAMLDIAEQAGLIDPTKRADWQSDYYVPFYRRDDLEGENEQLMAPYSKRGLSHQSAGIKRLLGGDMATNDLLENILINWSKLVDSSVKNDAMLKAVDNLKGFGDLKKVGYNFESVLISNAQIEEILKKDDQRLAQAKAMLGLDPWASMEQVLRQMARPENEGFTKMWAMKVPQEPDVIRVQRNGKNEYYRVNDDALLRALMFTGYSSPRGTARDLIRATKRVLTKGVTLTPDFIMRNFIRDSVHNWAIQKELRAGVDAIDGLQKAMLNDERYKELIAGGAAFQGGYATATDPEAVSENIRRGGRRFGMRNTGELKDSMLKVWEIYREGADRFENANRLAKFGRMREQGADRVKALYEAKDVMDFSLRGSHSTMLFFVDAVPFLNAKLQGASRTIRAFQGSKEELQSIATKLSVLALASTALAVANLDNDDYRGRPDWEKDLYWFFYTGKDDKNPIRVPKAFEVGFVGGTLPERFVHTAFSDQTGGDLAKSVARNAAGTFLFNPIDVQLVKPTIEVIANHKILTGTPIDSQGDMRLAPEARHNVYTSTVGYGVGKTLGLSPKRVDHMIKGYLGTMGAYALSLSDMALRPITDRPERPAQNAKDLPIASTITGGSAVKPNKFIGEFYELTNKTQEAYGTYRRLHELGFTDDADKLLERYSKLINNRKALFKERRRLAQARRHMREIENSRKLSPPDKRKQLNEIQTELNTFADELMQKIKELELNDI
jgi:hypothetical protein